MAAVFPVYFSSVAAVNVPPSVATARYAGMTTVALVLIAVAAPLLGAWADMAALRKRLLAVFMGVGVCATAGLGWVYSGDWQLAAVLFVIANIGVSGSIVFYDALLPHLARSEEIDQVSTAGYALGYLGGGLLLALNLAWIQFPHWFGLADAAAASGCLLSAWRRGGWCSRCPCCAGSRNRAARPARSPAPLLGGLVGRLRQSGAELRVYKNAGLLLLAFVIYNDGVGTIIRMAAIYGTEIGLSQGVLISAVLLVQFIGIRPPSALAVWPPASAPRPASLWPWACIWS